ncbi:MAG: hypothetical protein IT434_12660 [Phycisphaerales bacterium]|nr:hypothetical protein [Phycisphaerales bacterium]
MTQFEMPGPPGAIVRNQPIPIPSVGVTQTLNAPGVVPLPYTEDRGAQLADSILRGIGYAGRLAGDIAEEKRRMAIEQQRIDELAKASHEGAARLAVGTALPRIADEIWSRKLVVPDGLTPEEFATEYVKQHSADRPEAYRDYYARLAVPSIVREIYAHRRAMADQAQSEDLALRSQANTVETDAAAMLARVSESRKLYPNVPESELVGKLVLPALDAASKSGDAGTFNAANKALGDLFPAQRQAAEREFADTIARLQRERGQLAEARVYGLIGDIGQGGELPESVVAAIDAEHEAGNLGAEKAVALRGFVVHTAQSRFADALSGKVLRGEIDPATLAERVGEATKRDPGAVDYLDPDRGRALLNQAADVTARDVARQRVSLVLSGAPGYLTSAADGAAFDDVLKGAGIIDGLGRVARPDDLAASVLRARILPRSISETLVANLTGSDANDSAGAARAVGMIAAGSPRLFADLVDAAGPKLEPALTAAADEYARGRLSNQSTAPKSLSLIRDTLAAEPPAEKPGDDVLADLKRDKIDPTVKAGEIIKAAREDFPHTKDTLLGFDFLNPDPSMGTPGQDVTSLASKWYADRFRELRTRLPREQALQSAETYAKSKVENSIDFVRWGDVVSPVLIDRGRGLRMPEGLRWGDGFEDEAKADLTAAGHDPADVAAMRPMLEPATGPGVDPTSRMGWAFLNGDGDPITDAQGRVLIFRPSDKLATQNAEFRRLLDQKAGNFKPAGGAMNFLLPPRLPSETDTEYMRRMGRKRPGEF